MGCKGTIFPQIFQKYDSKKSMLHDLTTTRCQHALRMKLDTMDVILLMTQRHNLAVIAHRSDLQAGRETGPVDHPTMVSTHDQTFGQAFKEIVIAKLCTLRSDTMIHLTQIGQFGTKHFTNGLMA